MIIFWRRLTKKLRRDSVCNNTIQEIVDVKSTLISDIKTKQFIWDGHVQRMSVDMLPKQVIIWETKMKAKE